MSDKTSLRERLLAEAGRREAEWTRAPTMNPRTKFVHNEPLRELLAEAAAALARSEAQGEWVLVPREPTPEMLTATKQRGPLNSDWSLGLVGYQQMLAAAPPPPADRAPGEVGEDAVEIELCGKHGPWYAKGCPDCAADLDTLAEIGPPDEPPSFHDWKTAHVAQHGLIHSRDWYQRAYGKYREAERLAARAPSAQGELMIDFPGIGMAGPFTIAGNTLTLPDATMTDLVHHFRMGYTSAQGECCANAGTYACTCNAYTSTPAAGDGDATAMERISFNRWMATQAQLSPSLADAFVAGKREGYTLGRRVNELEAEMVAHPTAGEQQGEGEK